MKRFEKKSFWALVLVLAMAMSLLVGCGGNNTADSSGSTNQSGSNSGSSSNSSSSGDSAEVEKDTLIVAVAADSGDLNPHGNYSTSLARIKAQVYEGLFFLTYENELIPWLATGYEWKDDTTVEIKLREGVQFHCGGEMTAEDVMFSLEKVNESAQKTIVEKIDFENSKIIDDYTIELKCVEPYAPLITNLSYLPASIFSKEGYEANGGDWTKPIGTGPYVWGEWVTGSEQWVHAFENYWGEPVGVPNIQFKVIAEATNRVIELETGNCDLA